MKLNYKKLLTTITLILIIVSIIGISYAVYKNDKDNADATLVLTDEFFSINYLDGKNFELNEILPGDTYTKKISVTNVSNVDTYLTIGIMDIIKSSDNLKLTVIDNQKNVIYDKNITNIDVEVVKSVDLGVGKTLSYTIMVKNEGTETSSFYANILAYKEIIKQTSKTFKDTILENSNVKELESNVITGTSEGDEGLIKTKDDDGDSYIFRGNVTNNNVNFGGFNWKIVRINGDSTIRLVAVTALDNQSAYNSDSEITDNYTSKLEYNNSKIKEQLDSFLSSNLQENSKYIVESTFCEDITVFNEENDTTILNPYNRVFTENTPSLTCMGNKLKEKIGLLTVDEVVLAGAYQNNSNNSFYLHTNMINGSWWTMSGSQIIKRSNVVDAISVNRDGSLNYNKKISTQMYVRPVINLDSNTTVTGTGTVDDPYMIKQS